jgi:hypothetical protein
MSFHQRSTLGLVTVGLVLLVFSSWMLQITLPRRPATPAPMRVGPRKMARNIRHFGCDQRSASGHEPALVAGMLHDFAVRDVAG